MDDDLDMSIRAPYISMSESSELPLLISDDLMWGAQPNITFKKIDDSQQIIANNKNNNSKINNSNDNSNQLPQQFLLADVFTKNSSIDSSLTSLLCNQFLQQQQLQQKQQSEESTLNKVQTETVINVFEENNKNGTENNTDDGKIGIYL